MTELICDHETLFSSAMSLAEKCEKLAPVCAGKQEVFNFFDFYLCRINGSTWLFLLLALILLIIVFKFICAVIDEYIAPAIVYLSEWLGLSEALAGVTLLAFANGAGDVITAIVASESDDGVAYNIGALYGAGLFVLTLVVSIVITVSPKKIVVHKATIYRDIGFYILATLLTLGIAAYGSITVATSLIMRALYLLLVVVVVIQDCMTKKAQAAPKEVRDDEEKLTEEPKIRKQRRFTEIAQNIPVAELKKLSKIFNQFNKYIVNKAKLRREDEGFIGKAIDVVDYPFNWLRKLTIPPVEEEEYSHKLTIAWPVLGILFTVWALFSEPSYYWLIIIPVALVLMLFFYTNRPESNDELPKYYLLLVLLGIVNGILWTKLLCGVLVDLLTFIGVLSKLSTTYLGLTVIAIGNALPDGLTTIAIAKQGQAMMGLTGGIAGQLFGLLVGFGVSMLKKTAMEGPQAFDLFDMNKISDNILDLIVVGVALITLIFLFIYGLVNQFKFDKRLGKTLIVIYVLFVVACTVIAVYQAIA